MWRYEVMDPYWSYEDLGVFFFVLALLNVAVRLAVRSHWLRSTELVSPSLGVQSGLIIFLGIALYMILKWRYRRPVLAPLGWRRPTRFFFSISILGGLIAALGMTYLAHLQGHAMPTIPAKAFIVLGLLLGPILEESVFRGCLLPVLTRSIGSAASVLATAILFAAFHGPGDITHWVWFTATGLSYGSLRLASGTTTAPAFVHATCNLILFLSAQL